MFSEALETYANIVRQATTPQKLEDTDPRLVRYVVDGKVVVVDVEPAPRKHTAKCLDDLVALANRFAAEPNGDDENTTFAPVVWYDEQRVVVVIDDRAHRFETVTFPLQFSAPFVLLAELARSKAKHEQRAFIRLLRIDLAGTLDPVVLLEKVRRVEFENGQTVSASLTRQKESLGRQITSQIRTDAGDLPEEVTLSLPVYSTAGERDPVPCRCSVEADPADGTFRLMPLPDELQRVQQAAVARVSARLAAALSAGIPAYYGTP